MTTETIFNGETPPVVPPVISTPAVQVPTELAELVGEGKKYKSVEDALKSVPHAQAHIARVEQEAQTLRDELAKRKTAEELLESIRSGITPPTQAQPATGQVDTESVEQAIVKILAQTEAQKIAQANVTKVTSTFLQLFGDKEKAEAEYNRVATEAGLSVNMMNSLAATSPEAIFKMAGITNKAQPVNQGKPNSTVNTQALPQGGQGELSAKVPKGATTRDLVNAWKIAGEKVKQRNP